VKSQSKIPGTANQKPGKFSFNQSEAREVLVKPLREPRDCVYYDD